ncbi:hypothetical protein ABK040_008413 [Willaertia magna]
MLKRSQKHIFRNVIGHQYGRHTASDKIILKTTFDIKCSSFQNISPNQIKVRNFFFDLGDEDLKKKQKAQPINVPPSTSSNTSSNTTTKEEIKPNTEKKTEKSEEKTTLKDDKTYNKEETTTSSTTNSIFNPPPVDVVYGHCLNYKVQYGLQKQTLHRETEIQKMLDILSRSTDANVMLIGEKGSGRRSLVNGLAQFLTFSDPELIPPKLRDAKIITLDLDTLFGANLTNNVQTTFYTALKKLGVITNEDIPPHPNKATKKEMTDYVFGSNKPAGYTFNEIKKLFKEKADAVLNKKKEENVNAILFIPNLFPIVDDLSFNYFNNVVPVLRPLLESGKVKLIGSMNNHEFALFSNTSLVHNFQKLNIKELSFHQVESILEQTKEHIELDHGIEIPNDLLSFTIENSNRYIGKLPQPGKAISILDESASMAKHLLVKKPKKLVDLESSLKKKYIQQLEVNKEEIEKELIKLQKESKELNEQWLNEMKVYQELQEAKHKLFNYKQQLKEQLQTSLKVLNIESNEYKKVNEILTVDIPNIKQKINELKEKQKTNQLIKDVLTEEHVSKVICRVSGLDERDLRLSKQDRSLLLTLENEIEKDIVGQSDAIKSICESIRISKSHLREENKPIGSYLFLGPTGVGKTALAQQIAKHIFGSEDAITKIDLSEYHDAYQISRLIGTSPGYIGYGEGGILTNSIMKNPYQVILFDELEKGHPSVYNILLQIMDDAVLTDGMGRKCNFRNAIIILTSNIGTKRVRSNNVEDKDLTPKDIILDEVKNHLSPEFINRLDEMIIFNQLDIDTLGKILDIQLKLLEKRLSRNKEIKLEITSDAKHYILYNSFDINYGARPLKHKLQKFVGHPCASLFLHGKLDKHCTIKISLDNNSKQLTFDVVTNEELESSEKQKLVDDITDEILELKYKFNTMTQKQ